MCGSLSQASVDKRSARRSRDTFVYLKLWKRRGTVCTTDRREPRNVVDALR